MYQVIQGKCNQTSVVTEPFVAAGGLVILEVVGVVAVLLLVVVVVVAAAAGGEVLDREEDEEGDCGDPKSPVSSLPLPPSLHNLSQ